MKSGGTCAPSGCVYCSGPRHRVGESAEGGRQALARSPRSTIPDGTEGLKESGLVHSPILAARMLDAGRKSVLLPVAFLRQPRPCGRPGLVRSMPTLAACGLWARRWAPVQTGSWMARSAQTCANVARWVASSTQASIAPTVLEKVKFPPCKPRANLPRKAPACGCQIGRNPQRVFKRLPPLATSCRAVGRVRAPSSPPSSKRIISRVRYLPASG